MHCVWNDELPEIEIELAWNWNCDVGLGWIESKVNEFWIQRERENKGFNNK